MALQTWAAGAGKAHVCTIIMATHRLNVHDLETAGQGGVQAVWVDAAGASHQVICTDQSSCQQLQHEAPFQSGSAYHL